MTEEQIERKVERATDYIDRQFMAGIYTQTEYNRKMREISAWADGQYAAGGPVYAVIDVTFRYSLFQYGTLFSPAPQYNFLLQGLQLSNVKPYS